MFKLFNKSSIDNNLIEINDKVPTIIYSYLIKGFSLIDIEEQLIGTRNLKGWFSKSILNYYGIDTNGHNRGLYSGHRLENVIDFLESSNDLTYQKVAKKLEIIYLNQNGISR